jgi:hypothetical protein
MQASTGSGRSLPLRPRLAEGGGDHTASSSLSGADPAAAPAHDNGGPSLRASSAADDSPAAGASRMRKSVLSAGGRGSQAGVQSAGRMVSLVGGVGGPVRRRSALGAALEAHAGSDNLSVDPKEQVCWLWELLTGLALAMCGEAGMQQAVGSCGDPRQIQKPPLCKQPVALQCVLTCIAVHAAPLLLLLSSVVP